MIKFAKTKNEIFEFETEEEMKQYIIDEWYGLIKPKTITIEDKLYRYVYGQIDGSPKKQVVGLIVEDNE